MSWMMHQAHVKPTGQAIRKRLAHLIHEIANVPLEQITDSATVDGDIQMESVAFVELQVAIEDEFQIEIDPIQVVELNRFGAIADYVHHLIVNGSN
jgi:acyl carrier protein